MSPSEMLILIEGAIKDACEVMIKDVIIEKSGPNSIYVNITSHDGKVIRSKITVHSGGEV